MSIGQSDDLNWHLIFTYENKLTRRSFSLGYNKFTKEYLTKVAIGLTEFCDIDYLADSLDKLEALLNERLEKTLRLLGNFDVSSLGGEFLQKKILDWPYAEKLPGEILGFELFIAPNAPVKAVNGSYIIIDYSDFEAESCLIIYYNIFRDEFFGELKLRGASLTTASFDAKTLPDLEDKLKSDLETVLASLRSSAL